MRIIIFVLSVLSNTGLVLLLVDLLAKMDQLYLLWLGDDFLLSEDLFPGVDLQQSEVKIGGNECV